MALANIVNKPIVCYQVEYLLRHGIHDIQITVEKKFASKIERYLRNHFKDFNCIDGCSKTTIDLVVFLEEEEPVNVLKAMASRLHSDFVVIEGNALIDTPLDELLDTHVLCHSSITALIKEFDMSKGGKGAKQADVDSQDIFGVSEWSTDGYRNGTTFPKKACRIVLKSSKSDAKNGTINIKTSLLKKCNNIKIRADLADCGVYVFSQHALKLMSYVDTEKDFMWSKISTDVLPFFAKNQFKETLHKMLEEATKDKTKKKHHTHAQLKDQASRIDSLFNHNYQSESKKISINVIGHVDPMDSGNAYLRIQSTKAYMRANLEGQKLVQRFTPTKAQYQLEYRLFQPTDNNYENIASSEDHMQEFKQKNVLIRESNIMVVASDESAVNIGEGTTIQKSVIGRNVQIGNKTKISGSVILGNCQIGSDCIIQNSLILNKVVVSDKQQIMD